MVPWKVFNSDRARVAEWRWWLRRAFCQSPPENFDGKYVFVGVEAVKLLESTVPQGGKSNWVADKLEPVPEIYEAMVSAMCGSWNQTRSEIRVIDMPITSKEQLEQYLRRQA